MSLWRGSWITSRTNMMVRLGRTCRRGIFQEWGDGSDKNSTDAANFRRLSVGSMPHDDEDGISDEEKSDSDPEEAHTAVRLVVLIPKRAAEDAQENPKVAKLKERLINAYPRLFSGFANKNPPDRGGLAQRGSS